MNICYYTLGCKVNQYETQAMRELFQNNGHFESNIADADIIVINSCTVTAESDRKTRQLLRRCRRENAQSVIVLTGCMVQAFPEKAEELTQADIIVGNTDIRKIIELAEQCAKERRREVAVTEHINGECYNTPSVTDFNERTRAFMKIEDGCDRFCSYCIIPTARGRVRSRSIEDIKSEAEALAKAGYLEIVLVGINLSAYGKGEDFDLCDAVDAVASVEGIKRVRLGSLEPDHISDEMLARFKAQKKFCPQFHLSLQSGCDRTLKRMNRKYDSAFYYDLVTKIRNTFSDAAITTDIMVGFAGETEEEFIESAEFAKKVGFARAHIFAYSRREGTVAAGLPNQVTTSEKERRSSLLAQICKDSEQNFLQSLCGKTMPVLFENADNGYNEGYTPNYIRVCVKTEAPLTGKILNVKLIECEDGHCIGELI